MKIIIQLFSHSSVRAFFSVALIVLVFGLFFQVKPNNVEAESHVNYPKVQLFPQIAGRKVPRWQPQLAQWLTFGKQTVFALPDTDMGFSIDPKRVPRTDRPQEIEEFEIPVTPIDKLVDSTTPLKTFSIENSLLQSYQSIVEELPERPPVNWTFPTKEFWKAPGGEIITYLPKFSDEELKAIVIEDIPTRTVLSFELLPASRPRVRVMESCGNKSLDLLAYRRFSSFLHSSWGNPRMQKKILQLLEVGNSTMGSVTAEWRFRRWKK